MRARGLAVLLALFAAALGDGCLKRSKVARTYVLDPLAAAPQASAAAPIGVVGIERVSVPEWLDRPQITGRATSGEVVTDEFSRWGEPLPRGVQRVVTENLVTLLPDRRVVAAPFSPRDVLDQRLELTLVEAARQADGSVRVEARWTLLGPGGAVLARRRSTHASHPTALGAAGAVEGFNAALASLSRELAEAVGAHAAPASQASKTP